MNLDSLETLMQEKLSSKAAAWTHSAPFPLCFAVILLVLIFSVEPQFPGGSKQEF